MKKLTKLNLKDLCKNRGYVPKSNPLKINPIKELLKGKNKYEIKQVGRQ